MLKEDKKLKTELTLHGEKEKFFVKVNNVSYDCFLSRYWLQEGWALIQLTGVMKDEPEENFSYSGIVYEYDNKIKLKSDVNTKLPHELRKELNKRFSKMWNIRFV